ncbi:hypothetical protein ACWF62_15015 [Rhodococcus sp. NPDC054953]
MSNPNEYTDADLAEYEAELTDIATDPNLSTDEKLDALSNAVDEEIDEIVNSGSAPAPAPAPEPAPATEPAPAPEETPVTDPTAATASAESAPAGQEAPATADVVGDPATASYTTTTTSSTATATATTEVTVDGAAQPVSEPAPAPSEPVASEGNIDYYSPRDVDGDGNVDVIHARVDGIETITHVADDGTVTLVEQDTDSNGTYETASNPNSNGTVRVAEDKDDDGDVDLVTYLDPVTGSPVRQDEISSDGTRIVGSKFDTDGDGAADTHLVDSDGNGRFDSVALDTDGDGIVNTTLVDTDGDGAFDLANSDDDNDGTQESYMTSADNGVGSLGDISTYESLIPEGDSYHAQTGTDTYEPPVTDELPGDLA